MNYWDQLFEIRDDQREQLRTARPVLKFKETAWEINRQGKMKWYLHPTIRDTAHRAVTAYIQEIPPGSRSGKVRHQGGWGFYIWKGAGYSLISDKRYDWEEEDVVLLPIDAIKGVTFQHFNTSPDNPVLLLAFLPNTVDSLGIDMGIGLEQVEDCPEYQAV
jgi:gentisate 1,2-dioxygenase